MLKRDGDQEPYGLRVRHDYYDALLELRREGLDLSRRLGRIEERLVEVARALDAHTSK